MEIDAGGNSYTAEFWQYDARLGRRWNVDPVVKVFESPYAAFANNSIWFMDPRGADTTLPTADNGRITMPDGVSNIKTFDGNSNYTAAGNPISPKAGGLMSFSYNGVDFSAQYYASDQSFAYYSGTDGSILGYGLNTLSSNIEFTGRQRAKIAGGLVLGGGPAMQVARMNPFARLLAAGVAGGATLSLVYQWNNISNDFDLSRPLASPFPSPSLPVSIPFTGHGNRYNNTNPQMVYEFSFTPTDGRTPVLKYGIADMYKTGYDRPEKQLPAMMAMYGASVKWKPIMFTPDRSSALAAEAAAVGAHVGQYGEMPRTQILPRGR